MKRLLIFVLATCLSAPAATDALKRKKDIHTFSLNGEFSNTALTTERLNSHTTMKTYVVDMDADKWSDGKSRQIILNSLQAALTRGETHFSFPLITHEKSHNGEKLLLGKVHKKLKAAEKVVDRKKPYYVTFVKKNKIHNDLPIYDLYISKLENLKKIDNITSATLPVDTRIFKVPNFNFGKFFFQTVNLNQKELVNSCILDIQSYFAEFNRTRKKIKAKKNLAKFDKIALNELHVSNNCREPGNFELIVKGGSQKTDKETLLAGYFHLPYPFYDQIVKNWTGKTPSQFGIVKDRLALSGAKASIDYLSFPRHGETSPFQMNTLPTCHIRNLKPFVDNSDQNWSPFDLGKAGHQKGSTLDTPGEMKIAEGNFNFADFPAETQKKMAWKKLKRNSYLFIKVNKKYPPGSFLKRHKNRGYKLPKKFFIFKDNEFVQKRVRGSFLAKAKTGRSFWKLARKHKYPVYVPHRFDNYREMFGSLNKRTGILEGGFWDSKDPNILPSAFEVDGRYGGEQKIENYRAPRLWPVDLDFVQRLKYFDATVFQYQGGESSGSHQFIPPDKLPRVEIRLSCESSKKDFCKGKIHNLVIGNLSLKPGERKEILLGIGVEPLEVSYGKHSLLDFKVYALAYNKLGYIVDHNPEIGKVVVTRGLKIGDKENPYHYTIDIITDDRIHVLSRTVLDLKKAHIDFERKKVLNSRSVGLRVKSNKGFD